MTSRKHKKALRNLQMVVDSLVESEATVERELEMLHAAYGTYLAAVRAVLESRGHATELSEAVAQDATGVWKDNVIPLRKDTKNEAES
tara:strand:+ start:134 stop:397 length:264 start_codon:yes stop_codon:yes gene_type:complete